MRLVLTFELHVRLSSSSSPPIFYQRFLLTMGNIPAPMLKALSNTAFNLPLNMPDVVAHCAKAGLAVPAALAAADPAKGSRNLQSLFVSQVLTSGWSIPTHWAWFVADSFVYRTVIYYIPFNFTNVIVFQHPRIFEVSFDRSSQNRTFAPACLLALVVLFSCFFY